MAGNRFINQYYQYTPSGYLGKPLDYTPDLTGLNELATQYQEIYDTAVSNDLIKRLGALPQDLSLIHI